jgi:DNA modification methylase
VYSPQLAYSTELGLAYQGDSLALLSSDLIAPGSVDLLFTSPPFALTRPKDYGNKPEAEYLEWFDQFVPLFHRVLSEKGSLVVDIGGAYLPGAPRRSTYHFELAVRLAKAFELCQEFYWFNPAKLPTPAEWTNVQRVRVKDSVNLVLWLAKDAAHTHASNRRVLKRYSDSMRALLKNGYQVRRRPSNHDISDKFLRNNQGSIPANLLGFTHVDSDQLEFSSESLVSLSAPNDASLQADLQGVPFEEAFENLVTLSNTASTDRYLAECRRHSVKPHGARFPIGLPAFFIEFLTEPERNHLVLDPFAGSNTTGAAAELLGRKWISCDLDREGTQPGTYVRTSAFRFPHAHLTPEFDYTPKGLWSPHTTRAIP